MKIIMRRNKIKVGELYYNRSTQKRYQVVAIKKGGLIYVSEFDVKDKKELEMYPYKSFIVNFIPSRIKSNDIVACYSMGKLLCVNIVNIKNYDSYFRFKKPGSKTVILYTAVNSSGMLKTCNESNDVFEYRLIWGKDKELFERRTKYNRILSNLNKLKENVINNNGSNIIQDKYKLNKVDKELKILLKIFKEE